MTELDMRLSLALAADAPPAMDPLFRVEVMLRLQRVALRRQVAEALGFAFASAVLAVLVLNAVHEVFKSNIVIMCVNAILASVYVSVLMRHYLGIPLFGQVLSARITSVAVRLIRPSAS